MRKITLLTALLALFTASANAGTKILHRWSSLSADDWARHGNVGVSVVSDEFGSYYTLTNSGSGQRGAVLFWNDVIGEYTSYKLELTFNIASYNATDAGRYLGAEFSFLSTDIDATKFNAAGNAQQTQGYVLDFMQRTGEGGVAPTWAVNTFFVNGSQENIALLPTGGWYKLTVEVDGTSINYSVKEDGNDEAVDVVSGSTSVPEGVTNKMSGLYLRLARAQGALNLSNLIITTQVDEDVANKPTLTLTQVKGNDRVYQAVFDEGETLHYILPGGEEQTMDYYDAEDEEGKLGRAQLTATQSGTLEVWTSMGDAVSDHETTEVSCGWIKLVDPVVAISSVSEGYGKSYTVTFNDSDPSHLLPVNAAITYTIDDGESVELKNGGTIEMEKQGKLTVTVNQIPIGGQEYYERSTVTVYNDVEYVEALKVEYINWDESHFNGNWTAGKLEDSNMSHWAGHWQEANRYDKEEQNKMKEDPSYTPVPTQNPVKVYRTDGSYDLPIYTLTNDEKGVNYATELLPLIPNTARANVAILLEEGIFANTTAYNNLELTFDPQWVTDDASKPNFIEIRKTGSYDRYDNAGRHITDIVETTKTDYTLFRFDTAIHSARVFTYKGFVPTTGIEAVKTVAPAVSADAPIYNLSGVRVANASQKGIYIQNGKKFVVK